MFVVGTLADFLARFPGFSNLLGRVCPVLGCIGMVMLVVMVAAGARGRTRIAKEVRTRDRLRELAFLRLHPRRKLTARDEREVRGLAEGSCVNGGRLWRSVREGVMEELEHSSDTP